MVFLFDRAQNEGSSHAERRMVVMTWTKLREMRQLKLVAGRRPSRFDRLFFRTSRYLTKFRKVTKCAASTFHPLPTFFSVPPFTSHSCQRRALSQCKLGLRERLRANNVYAAPPAVFSEGPRWSLARLHARHMFRFGGRFVLTPRTDIRTCTNRHRPTREPKHDIHITHHLSRLSTC